MKYGIRVKTCGKDHWCYSLDGHIFACEDVNEAYKFRAEWFDVVGYRIEEYDALTEYYNDRQPQFNIVPSNILTDLYDELMMISGRQMSRIQGISI